MLHGWNPEMDACPVTDLRIDPQLAAEQPGPTGQRLQASASMGCRRIETRAVVGNGDFDVITGRSGVEPDLFGSRMSDGVSERFLDDA
jgi:hypothetical protein